MAVTFEQRVDIDATPETVWGLITDATKWPLWIEQMEHVEGLDAVTPGASFQWRHGNDSGTGAVLEVDEKRMILKLATRMGNDERHHTFDIDRSGGFLQVGARDSRVRYTYSYDVAGGLLGSFVVSGNPADTLRVKNTLQKLKRLAESLPRA
ncbi:MAG: SRPBCC family protein [Chloroflexaceae bacterium]|nr:SRPBCC family protein [Chloroflexaceae bacterium]